MKNKITILVHGGLVQDIIGIPKDVEVEVLDYDIEGADPDNFSQDEDGNDCVKSVYVHVDTN